MLNLLSNTLKPNFDNFIRTINVYSSNNPEKYVDVENDKDIKFGRDCDCDCDCDYNCNYRDIESLEYLYIKNIIMDIKNIEDDSHIIANQNNNNNDKLLPIGVGYCCHHSLIWKRKTTDSNYEIIYKGKNYLVDYKQLEKIQNKIKIDFETMIMLYLDNDMDYNTTVYQLIV